MELTIKILPIIAGSLLGLAFIFFVASNAVPNWSAIDVESVKFTAGLWMICGSSRGLEECVKFDCSSSEIVPMSSCNKLLAARAFVTLACLMSGISALCIFLSLATADKTRFILLIVGKGLAFASLVMGIIGVAIGINVHTENNSTIDVKWGAGAILGIVAIIINCGGAVTSLFVK